MSFCMRINENCQNRRKTIYDTNFFINFFKYIVIKKKYRFRECINEFKSFMDRLSDKCWIDEKAYCSQKVYDEEFCRTLIFEVKLLNELNKRDQNEFKNLLRNYLIIKGHNEEALDDLKIIVNELRGRNEIGDVGRADLSLLYIALDDIKAHESDFLIVTHDESFYKLILSIKNGDPINLAGITYNRFNLTPITTLPYLTTTFKCCNFADLEGLGINFLLRRSYIPNKNLKKKRLINTFDWIADVYTPARNFKNERNQEVIT